MDVEMKQTTVVAGLCHTAHCVTVFNSIYIYLEIVKWYQ